MSELYAAVGMVEFTSIAAGIDGADRMIKSARVQPIFFKTICPGKFVAAVTGDVASVTSAVAAARERHPDTVVDWFVIANIHPEVVQGLAGVCPATDRKALGIIETFSAISVVMAADAAVKAANVHLVDVRIALALGGKGYILLTGDVTACEAAVEAGGAAVARLGLLVGKIVIANPSEEIFAQLG
ncbi:BMC domain-containing protein [Siculibacillus lacustris]|uniref:BMC domain-containing protein n=1 Tax=Siculibacillus lacustris TaxID=1549641 RepID=A0A4Q9VJS2_9HYPH|nr:BMC domain-containing protein [Siculibacillus lacustris]TBW35342.1 BMC domain-containing protein [Siculibacillus lacustris]